MVSIHSTASIHSSPLQVQPIYRNWIYFHVRSVRSQSITLSDYDNFSPFFYFLFFCSEYAWVLFVLSGLLQIKEQTNRSCAPRLLLYDWEAFAMRYSAISKGHQLPWLCCTSMRPGQKGKMALTSVITLHAYFCLREVSPPYVVNKEKISPSCPPKKSRKHLLDYLLRSFYFMHCNNKDFGFSSSESFKGIDIALERRIRFPTYFSYLFSLHCLSFLSVSPVYFYFLVCFLDKVWVQSPMLQADSMSGVWLRPLGNRSLQLS